MRNANLVGELFVEVSNGRVTCLGRDDAVEQPFGNARRPWPPGF
jgi:hypothetical protein